MEIGKHYMDKKTGLIYYVAYYGDSNDLELIDEDGIVISKSDNGFDLCHEAGIDLNQVKEIKCFVKE